MNEMWRKETRNVTERKRTFDDENMWRYESKISGNMDLSLWRHCLVPLSRWQQMWRHQESTTTTSLLSNHMSDKMWYKLLIHSEC